MNKRHLILGVVLVALLLTGCNRGGNSTSSSNSDTSVTSQTSSVVDDYYKNIGENLSGNDLLNALNSLNNSRLLKRVGYDESLNKPASGFYVTDPGISGDKYSITAFYSGTERKGTSGMNREHVWPASRTVGGRGNDPLEDDIHMIRPTVVAENQNRGNSFYVEGMNTEHDGWDPKAAHMDETFRGDAARIIFYCAIADTRLRIIDSNSDNMNNHTMGKLSDLLKWNLQYATAQRENIRNNGAESLQGNRNPFIDHPEYACRIWGSTNSTTRNICGM